MAVVWEVLGMSTNARIVATCEVCHNSTESNNAKPAEAVARLMTFKHCGRVDTPPDQIKEQLLYMTQEKAIEEKRIIWI
jgi:hypothetical protein